MDSKASTLVVGDLHLWSDGDPRPAQALVALLAREPDAHLVFAGDTLDFAAEGSNDDALAAKHLLASFPDLSRAIAERASRGVSTTFLAGNHDASVASPTVLAAIHGALALTSTDRMHVRASPWFTRVGEVHVEHGHVFDPDGAPAHPLAPAIRDDVGIRIYKRFVVPIDGHDLVHANAEPPIKLLARVFRRYGPRAPYVVAKYIQAAVRTATESGRRFPLEADRVEGKKRLESFAAEVELDRDTLERLIGAHATPTMARFTSACARMYLDRVSACAAMAVGAATAVVAPPMLPVGASIATLGALSLSASLIAGADRYGGRVHDKLANGAQSTIAITGARAVVMGHVHVPIDAGAYRNTGSFAFSAHGARPYIKVVGPSDVLRAVA
jgi:UDP-2,3-diacylglucosamine pyrophosphatase LpxH